jgi:hypothetical protein
MTSLFNNPLLSAQSISKKAVERSGQLIYDFFSEMEAQGYIEGFEFEMKPYNNGYELRFEPDCNLEKLENIPSGLRNYCFGTYIICFYPESFFNSYFKEGNASITYRLFNGEYKTIKVNKETNWDTLIKDFWNDNHSKLIRKMELLMSR